MPFQDQHSCRLPRCLPLMLHSPGLPLEPEIRGLMEVRFGRRFGDVQVHIDDVAASLAGSVGAEAFTAGTHIVFGEGRYDPGTREGLWLLAHEIAHVVQQRGECPFTAPEDAGADPLEHAADHAADVVAAGHSMRRDFAFGVAPLGVIQRHPGPICGGWSSIADANTIFQAHRLLELAYEARPMAPPVAYVVYGSNNLQEPNNVAVGGETLNAYIAELLATIRLWPLEQRPNILNITEREAYFFWRFPAPGRVTGIINGFHNTENNIARRHGLESQFNSALSNWFPDHALPFPGDVLERFVCTSMTEHQPPRGLILYDIRQRKKPRRAQRTRPVTQYELTEFDQGFKELGKSLWEELPSQIQFYDPQNPNYVFIVPKDFYHEWYRQKNASEKTKRMWDKFQVKPSYDFPGGSLLKDQRARYHALSKLLAIAAAAGIVFVGGVMIIPATASMATVATVAEATAVTGAEVYGPVQQILVSARIAAQVGARYTATGATIGMTAGATAGATGGTLAAVAATPAVKATVAAAGVLMVIIGGTSPAHAKDLPKAKVSAIRAVAVDDFQPLESVQTAVSGGPPTKFSHTPETAKGKFKPGTLVLFDAVPHVIIGAFSVR